MPGPVGNSGAPRWYDLDSRRLEHYVEHLLAAGSEAQEVVLHHGEADEFTRRIHVLQSDWSKVIRAYRDAGLRVYVHAPLTPDFAIAGFRDDRSLIDRYQPVVDMAAEIANDQGESVLVLHGASDDGYTLESNEKLTSQFVGELSDRAANRTDLLRLSVELRARKMRRPTASATSRSSVCRIIDEIDAPNVGICWDIAHDVENARRVEVDWEPPDREFLDYVNHLHLHDIAEDHEPHCPLVYGVVPWETALQQVPDSAAILEIRWHMAERLGDPWTMLAESYEQVLRARP